MLFLDILQGLELPAQTEPHSHFSQQFVQLSRQLPTCKIIPLDRVGQRISLVDGDCVGHAVSGVQHDTRGAAGTVKGEDCLIGSIEGGDVEGLEHDFCHFFAIGLGVLGGWVGAEILSVRRQGCSSGVTLSSL